MAYCHAGCSFEAILESLELGRERFTPSPRPIETGPSKEQLEAQRKAMRLWTGAKPADPAHPYLVKKQIKPHHLRQFKEILLVPMQNESGDLWNCQLIYWDGSKIFLRGGRTKGLFTTLGEIPESGGRIFVAEGFATAATIHELTGSPVVVAFSAHNLPPVSMIIRRAFPQAEIVLAADDDPAGVQFSEQAARAVHGLVAYSGRRA
ncbi:hypothetical protein Y981_02155 [Leptospirillum ferriphilum YSK]|uniref:Toprim domain-containing protein n=1 Tax=Leptospirillum ferriphilum YSK TaxID=1441628 RepID=A0A059XNC7_9BACT|nr:hypothetical protein Y981_02155 [Leptospirillum ferriphilum YSK]